MSEISCKNLTYPEATMLLEEQGDEGEFPLASCGHKLLLEEPHVDCLRLLLAGRTISFTPPPWVLHLDVLENIILNH